MGAKIDTTGLPTPGLRWRKRAGGRMVPLWIAEGCPEFTPRSVPLWRGIEGKSEREAAEWLSLMCQRYQAELTAFVDKTPKALTYDGTVGSLLEVYRSDPESPYQKLKPGSRHPYGIYIDKMKAVIGRVRLSSVTGRDVRRWHAGWRKDADGSDHLPRAAMMVAVLKAAIRFGKEDGQIDAIRLHGIIAGMEFEKPRRREEAPRAEQIIAARKAAHELGRPRAALAFALQFEGTLRQYDTIGIWVPLSDPRPSAIVDRGEKWIGPTWRDVDENLILDWQPGKTERTTGARVHIDLKLCPMVMAELQHIPAAARIGPLVIHEGTGVPWRPENFTRFWTEVRAKAGIPATVWNRDLRAGGITEGGMAGVTADDRAKVAGHAKPSITAKVYDRDKLEAARRVSTARTKFREGG